VVLKRPDFDARAATYDDLRPQNENWWELFELVSREADLRGQRVLDVGCGTGRLVAALAPESSVWGIDSSTEMLGVARKRVPANVKLKLARAEDPPLKDSWFDRVVYWLVVHLLDRRAAAARTRRARLRRHVRLDVLLGLLAEPVLPALRGDRSRTLPDGRRARE
jgi:ubiquinone/menaquinone biosynthesis C-methylase UbiE